jgi:hypothetical protein
VSAQRYPEELKIEEIKSLAERDHGVADVAQRIDVSGPYERSGEAATATLSPGKGLLILAGVVVAIGGFIALNYALGINNFWPAFLFLLYWSGIEQMKFSKLPSCIIGASVGLLMGYLLQTLSVTMGATGGLFFLGAILLLSYSQIMGFLPVAINIMTMLFLTVATIPALQASTSFASLAISLTLGIAYFVGLLAFGHILKQRTTKR